MKEKLRKKKLLLKLIGVGMVVIAVITAFIPIFKVTKTEETLGIKETITAEFSVWQIITQDKDIALKSTSALGEFEGFNTIGMAEIFGEKTVALTVMMGLIALAIPFVLYGIGLVFTSLLDSVQRGTVKCFLISYLLFAIFPLFPLSIVEESTGFSMSPPIVFIVILAAVMIALTEVFDKIFEGVAAISAELFIRKYKNENKKWFETFINDIMEFMNNANIQVETESFVRFLDAFDRKEMREKDGDDEDREN